MAAQTELPDRIPFGDEISAEMGDGSHANFVGMLHQDREECFTCGAWEGQLHEKGCDQEPCPVCGRQLIACQHAEAYGIEPVETLRVLDETLRELGAGGFYTSDEYPDFETTTEVRKLGEAAVWVDEIEFDDGEEIREVFIGFNRESGESERLMGFSEEGAHDLHALLGDTLIPYRIPYGEEEVMDWTQERCHDCGAARGEIHMDGCDAEECPKCGGQLITCGHAGDYMSAVHDLSDSHG